MRSLFQILVFLVVAAIWIISALAKAKQASRKDEPSKPSDWTRMAGRDQIQEFLEEASRQTGARRQAPGPKKTGPTGMPAGGVTPTAPRTRRAAAPQQRAQPARGTRGLRQLAPSQAKESTRKRLDLEDAEPLAQGEKPTMGPRLRGRKRTLKTGIDRGASARRGPQDRIALAAAASAPAPEARAAPQAAQPSPAETATLIPELKRQNLRRAIVMAEVLGTPIGLRPPGS